MKKRIDLSQPGLNACACFNLRKAARSVTQLYDQILQPSGLRATQLSILVGAYSSESETISRLAETLVMDRTTLTRDLKPLEREGLVSVVPGEDRRTRVVTLTKQGRKAVEESLPLWQKAQARVIEGFGEDRFHALLSDLSDTVDVTRGE